MPEEEVEEVGEVWKVMTVENRDGEKRRQTQRMKCHLRRRASVN